MQLMTVTYSAMILCHVLCGVEAKVNLVRVRVFSIVLQLD